MTKQPIGKFDSFLGQHTLSARPLDVFFQEQDVALTFDDVRLATQYSDIRPYQANLETRLSRHVKLNIPVVSAAMDTVTERDMAKAMAKLGGIGVIHRGLSVRDQASQVAEVKLSLNQLVQEPAVFTPSATMKEIYDLRMKKGWRFESFPIVDGTNHLVGIVTGRHFKFCDDYSVQVGSVMSRDVVTAPAGTGMDEAYRIMKEKMVGVLPLVDDDGCIQGMYAHSDIKRIRGPESARYNIDANGNLVVAAAIGVIGPGSDTKRRVDRLMGKKARVDAVFIDTAHADALDIRKTMRWIKHKYPDLDLIVGNVSEPYSAAHLAEWGADAIKVGQGAGSICTTSVISGIGKPQLTAIYECSIIAREAGIPLIADGGVRYSGDILKALAAGADCVMLGNMLAGTDESPGDIKIREDGTRVKIYRGMGSVGAMVASKGSRQRYRQGEVTDKRKLVPEGVEGQVEYKGPMDYHMYQILGGVKSGMGSQGAHNIRELQENALFFRVTNAGVIEAHPHDVMITEQAPNYSGRR